MSAKTHDNPTQPEPEPVEWAQRAWTLLDSLRASSPLIQCITNTVSHDFVANVLLSAGASPAMVHSSEEIPDFTPKVHALYVNVGTLDAHRLPAMKAAAQVANEHGKPWVLDPVAAGCSDFRLRACLDLLEMRPWVVRGNASEILALYNGRVDEYSKGVDSTYESTDAIEAAKALARTTKNIVAVSGAVDIITDGDRVIGVKNGVPMMQKITATGCSVTALISAFVAVNPSKPFEATAIALSLFGLAGELGSEEAKGPSSLRTNLIDALYGLNRDIVIRGVAISNM